MDETQTGATFGPSANADETRQAQHMAANDTPLDVNLNAVVGRSQGLTFDMLGKEFAACAARRAIIADSQIGKA